MAKSRTKFYDASIVKKGGKTEPIGEAFRFKEGTIYVHLDKKKLGARCIKLEPKGRSD